MGDYDLTRFGPWYGDRFSSIPGTVESVRFLRGRQAQVWLTGHETGLFEAEPRGLWDPYLGVIQQREEKLLSLLSEPRSMADIVNAWIVYGRPREPKGFFEFGEKAIMGKHLQLLMEQGIVIKDNGRFHLAK
jgi:hypothetical protein